MRVKAGPDSISVAEFISNESYGRLPFAKSRNPYTCGITGKSYSALEVIEREDYLSRALDKELDFDPCQGSEWDRVISIFSLNTIDYIPITHAVHRLSGIVTPVSFTALAAELEQQPSDTSGLPKAVMISHRSIIANVLQMTFYESAPRKEQGVLTQAVLGALPFSHIYGLVPITHLRAFRGDEIIFLPRFELAQALRAVAQFKIEQLFVVPPILVQMLNNAEDTVGGKRLDSVRKMYPKWHIGQGYGLTETAMVVTSTNELDIWDGSIGTLIPDTKAKIIAADGSEVTSYDTPGELLIQSPSVVLGYMGNEKATAEAFFSDDDGRWLRTGDEELIKVNGYQVAPAELEAYLLSHPYVADCAVIQVPDPCTGELPKAFVVKGGIEFVQIIPKSPSGKILRRLLRDKERESRRVDKAKI
ncbi:hypothetical protein NXS19_004722 [Fusarium pseudograminearum]|nr:hypothetical protein NXS19_004722 [Fusarium pseudograminearum]